MSVAYHHHVPHVFENMKKSLRLGNLDYFTANFPYSHDSLSCQMMGDLLDITQKRLMKLQVDAQTLGGCGDKDMQFQLLEDSKHYLTITKTLYDTLHSRQTQYDVITQNAGIMKRSASFLKRYFGYNE